VHDLKTYAVDVAQASPGSGKKSTHSGPVDFNVHEFHVDQGKDILPESPNSLHTQAALQKSEAFNQNVSAFVERGIRKGEELLRWGCGAILLEEMGRGVLLRQKADHGAVSELRFMPGRCP
jgi:hypothetical protein